MNMKFAYFPGCSLESTAREYGLSVEAVCARTGLELIEIPDWNCCGATSAHSTDPFLAIALPARNLILAQEMGLDIIAPCAACFNRLKVTINALRQNPGLNQKIKQIFGKEYEGKIDVRVLIQVILEAVGYDFIIRNLQRPLQGLKVANYYGCLLVRPPDITQFDDPENPQSLDKLMNMIGAQSVRWYYKTECCGGSLSLARPEVVLKLVYGILSHARDAGAECLVTACPLCHANLDLRQHQVVQKYQVEFNLPIFYFTQLLGLALGIHPNQLGVKRHLVNTFKLLRAKELVS